MSATRPDETPGLQGTVADATLDAPGVSLPTAAVPGYEIVAELGRGGMGVVYRAWQPALKRFVALKRIRAEDARPEALARFRREAQLAAQLQHPNIVQVHEVGEYVGESGPVPFIAFEYIEGGSLDAYLHGEPQPPRDAAELVRQLALAVQHAHERGIVHRDLKPANVLLVSGVSCLVSGEEAASAPNTKHQTPNTKHQTPNTKHQTPNTLTPKITDFGLARQLQDESPRTQAGAVLGTPCYMAPEQAEGRGSEVGPLADVYALGAILYECLTGRPPLRGATPLETLAQVRTQEPVAVRQLQPGVPRDLETIAHKCLEKTPARRYTSARELADELGRYLRDEPIRARPPGVGGRLARWCKRNPARAVLAGVSALALLAVVGVSVTFADYYRRSSEEAERTVEKLEQAQGELKESLTNRARTNARLQLREGLQRCRQGAVDEGLLFLARGLGSAVEGHDEDLERVLRINLAAWTECLNRPVGGFDLTRSDIRNRVTILSSPDGKGLLVPEGAAIGHRLFDMTTGKPLAPALEGDRITHAAFSPDGTVLADADTRGQVRLLHMATGKLCGKAGQHGAPVVGVVFAPDGKQFFTAGGKTLQRWNGQDGSALGSVPLEAEASSVLTGADGRRFAVVSRADRLSSRHVIQVRDAATGAQLGRTLTCDSRGGVLALTPDGDTVAVADGGVCRLCSAKAGTAAGEPLSQPDDITAMVFLGDGGRLLTGSQEGLLRVWDVASRQRLGPPLTHGSPIRQLYPRLDGRTVLVEGVELSRTWDLAAGAPLGTAVRLALVSRWHGPGPGENTWARLTTDSGPVFQGRGLVEVRVWEPGAGPCRHPPLQHPQAVREIAFTLDGELLTLSAAFDRPPRLERWHAGSGTTLPLPAGLPRTAPALGFSPDGRAIAVAAGSSVLLLDVRTGEKLTPPLEHPGPAIGAFFTADGQQVVTRCVTPRGSEPFTLWDGRTGKHLGPPFPSASKTIPPGLLVRERLGPLWYRFSHDGRTYLTARYQKCTLTDTITGKRLGPASLCNDELLTAAFHPDGRLALGLANGRVRLYESTTGAVVGRELSHQGAVPALAFSPDGRTLMTGSDDRTARLWDLATSATLTPALEHPAGVSGVSFSPDGRLAATLCKDNHARLWDVRTGLALGPSLGHLGPIETLVFRADGSRLATGSQDGVARLWAVPAAMQGDPARLAIELELQTGLALDANDVVKALDEPGLAERRQRLRERGAAP